MRIVRGDDHASDQHAQDVEDQDTVEDPSDSFGDVPPWRFGFGCGDRDEFHSLEGEGRLDEHAEETEEATGVLVRGDEVFVHGSRVLPVSESASIMIGSSAKVDDETEENETGDEDN